jgi:hypothetical protein
MLVVFELTVFVKNAGGLRDAFSVKSDDDIRDVDEVKNTDRIRDKGLRH